MQTKRKLSETYGLQASEALVPKYEASFGTIFFKVQPSPDNIIWRNNMVINLEAN